mgnify:CR=1 FL=1
MEYPKINTIWQRDEKTHRIIEGKYSCPEFAAIDMWVVTEKIDGTNIRIIYRPNGTAFQDYCTLTQLPPSVEFRGKTDNAEINPALLAYLQQTFTLDKLKMAFPEPDTKEVVLFGEGFGGRIQHGGRYRNDPAVALFDAWIDGWWLQFRNVLNIAHKLEVPHVPLFGVSTRESALRIVTWGGEVSRIAEDKNLPIEGIVATSEPMMMFRNGGAPIRWKLKAKDLAQKVA